MPQRRPPAPPVNSSSPPHAGLRQRYDELEAGRAALLARLAALQAAAWLIDVLEKLTANT